MATTLPDLKDVSDLFTMLFGEDTLCREGTIPLRPEGCAIVATYCNNDGAVKRLLACDLPFANSAGAALSMIPPGTAGDATKSGAVPDNILANLSEVMNIAVNLFTDSFGGRLELTGVFRIDGLMPEIRAALTSNQRVTVEVTVPRYLRGRVDLIAVE